MPKEPKEPRFNRTIAVPPSVMNPAERLAKELGISMNTLIVDAIRAYVQSHTQAKRTA